MTWVRMHPFIANWPGGGPPPIFDISADENGRAVVELAWDPQALTAPASYTQNLRYYSSDTLFSGQVHGQNGALRTLTVPAQNIAVTNNQAQWVMPADLWDGFLGEHLASLNGGAAVAGFRGSIYYRVRFTPAGGQATVWPTDQSVSGLGQNAPHLSMLPMSATPSSQVLADDAAVAAAGGPPAHPTAWADALRAVWRNLPESDPDRASLTRVLANATYRGLPVPARGAILRLWLLAGPSRQRVPALLDRQAVTGSGVTQPIVTKVDLRGGKTLVDNLLDLLTITPHPDLVSVTTHEQLVDDVLTEILDPNGQVNQGPAGTCAPTSVQTMLVTVNPAEYARLVRGLLSTAGSATLANGDSIQVPPTILQLPLYLTSGGGSSGSSLPALFVRTYAELAFQAATLRYGQGTRFPALTGTPQANANVFAHVLAGGLFAAEIKKLLQGVFNTTFTETFLPPAGTATPTRATIAAALVRDLPAAQQQLLIALSWGPALKFGHAVLGVRTEGSRLFFKNPQYAGSAPVGGAVAGGNDVNPPRRYEDPRQSLESMTVTDLGIWVMGYWKPDSALI